MAPLGTVGSASNSGVRVHSCAVTDQSKATDWGGLTSFLVARVATREESGVLGFPSRRGLTPRGHPRASSAKTRGFHTQLDEGPETP